VERREALELVEAPEGLVKAGNEAIEDTALAGKDE
jgi:hypothetical protein